MADDTPEVETLAEHFARLGITLGENESTESSIVFGSSRLMDALKRQAHVLDEPDSS